MAADRRPRKASCTSGDFCSSALVPAAAMRPVALMAIDAAPLKARRILERLIAAEEARAGQATAGAQDDDGTLVGTTS